MEPEVPSMTSPVTKLCATTLALRVCTNGPGASGEIDLPEGFQRRYQILRPLGSGGWSMVYAALDLAGKKQVAIKFLLRQDRPEDLVRFLHEGELLREVRDDHVIRILEVGELQSH